MKQTNSPARGAATRVAVVLLALAGVGGLVLAIDPHAVAGALGRFDLRALGPVVALGVVFYALQGLRWHLLLRQVGAAGRVADSQLVNLAGQAVTAVLPLGDLTRALMASRISGVPFGATAATVTVQELSFTLLVVTAAVPGFVRLPGGVLLMLAVVAGVAAVIALLTVPRLFDVARRSVAATPGLRRFAADVEALHREVRHLAASPAVLAGTLLDLGRVVAATAAFLVILRALHIDAIGWWETALVLAASFVGGALSLLPGGIGANEAGVVGLLVLLGVNPAAAAAAAIVQRLSLIAVPTVGGAVAYAVLRRRLRRATATAANAAMPSSAPVISIAGSRVAAAARPLAVVALREVRDTAA